MTSLQETLLDGLAVAAWERINYGIRWTGSRPWFNDGASMLHGASLITDSAEIDEAIVFLQDLYRERVALSLISRY